MTPQISTIVTVGSLLLLAIFIVDSKSVFPASKDITHGRLIYFGEHNEETLPSQFRQFLQFLERERSPSDVSDDKNALRQPPPPSRPTQHSSDQVRQRQKQFQVTPEPSRSQGIQEDDEFDPPCESEAECVQLKVPECPAAADLDIDKDNDEDEFGSTRRRPLLTQSRNSTHYHVQLSIPILPSGAQKSEKRNNESLSTKRTSERRQNNKAKSARAAKAFSIHERQSSRVRRRDHVVERDGGRQQNTKLWSHGIIPVAMGSSFTTCQQDVIFRAMKHIEGRTCLQFVDFEDRIHDNYLVLVRGDNCSSHKGMLGGDQYLELSESCFSMYTLVHELLRTAGFPYEISREDRDQFVDIHEENIDDAFKERFAKDNTYHGFGLPYDIRSIMHFSSSDFGIDNCAQTISPIDDTINFCEIGKGNGEGGMSRCDEAKINRLYECDGNKYRTTCDDSGKVEDKKRNRRARRPFPRF